MAKGEAVKPWEVMVDTWERQRDGTWWWDMRRKRDKKGPGIRAWSRKPHDTRASARAAALRVMKRLGLVEKAKAGKD